MRSAALLRPNLQPDISQAPSPRPLCPTPRSLAPRLPVSPDAARLIAQDQQLSRQLQVG